MAIPKTLLAKVVAVHDLHIKYSAIMEPTEAQRNAHNGRVKDLLEVAIHQATDLGLYQDVKMILTWE